MKFTKVSNGQYRFEGIDSWNGQIITGRIVYQPLDKPLDRVWEIRFDGSEVAEMMTPTLKQAKRWLTA